MNYKILKELLINIKNRVQCEACQKNFVNQDLSIQDISENSVKVVCTCSKCSSKAIIDIKLSKGKAATAPKSTSKSDLSVQAQKINIVSQDDVLDFKNYLKDFSGDFKSLFKK